MTGFDSELWFWQWSVAAAATATGLGATASDAEAALAMLIPNTANAEHLIPSTASLQ